MTAATTAAEDSEERVCSVCGEKETRSTARLGKIVIVDASSGKIKENSDEMFAISSNMTMAELLSALSAGVTPGGEAQTPFTGMKVELKHEGELVDSVTICVKGDVDGDGKVTAADARLALRQSVNLEKLNGGVMSAADARMILRASVNLEKPESLLA